MKIRFLPSILFFLSAYSPLAIIFLIHDFDWNTKSVMHPIIVYLTLGIAFFSILLLILSLKRIKTSSPYVTLISVTNKSGELLNYTIPYMISFILMDLSNTKLLINFAYFMILMYVLAMKTHNIFNNPILAIFGYNLYDVKYQRNGIEQQSFFLFKGERLKKGEQCRIIDISEHLFLVTEKTKRGANNDF